MRPFYLSTVICLGIFKTSYFCLSSDTFIASKILNVTGFIYSNKTGDHAVLLGCYMAQWTTVNHLSV